MFFGLLIVMCLILDLFRLVRFVIGILLFIGVISISVLLMKLWWLLVVSSFCVLVLFIVFWLVEVKMLIGVFLVICVSSVFDVVKLSSILVLGCWVLNCGVSFLKVFVRLVVVEMVRLVVCVVRLNRVSVERESRWVVLKVIVIFGFRDCIMRCVIYFRI